MACGDEFDGEVCGGQPDFEIKAFCLEINFLKANFCNLLN